MTAPTTPEHRDTIAQLLLDRADDPTVGLRTHDGSWTWQQVVSASAERAAIADGLRQPGPFHIGVLLDNVAEFHLWLGGAALSGATIVALNPTHGRDELAHEVEFTDVQLIVTDSDKAAEFALEGYFPSDRIIVIDSEAWQSRERPDRVEPPRAPDVDAGTLFLLLFTSGTTGQAKAVRCTQGRLTRYGYTHSAKWGVTGDDVSYCCMPLFHGNALMALWASVLTTGGTLCLTPKFSVTQFWADVNYFGATYFTYVGKVIGHLLSQEGDHSTTLRHGFGTEATPDDQASFRRRFGVELKEGYGSSEGSGLVIRDTDAPPGALGRPAHADIVVVDPQTSEVKDVARLDDSAQVMNPDDAVGEIVDRSGARRFEGYYKNDSADQDRLRGGWYWTGDLGFIDTQGFLHFAGRRGDWIRVGGENISALSVERAVRRFPGVITAAAYAVPDPKSGDQIMAAVETEHPLAFDVSSLAEYLADQPGLGSKSVPKFVRVSAGLPTTGSNKVIKTQLATEAWNCADPVYWLPDRHSRQYVALTAEDVQTMTNYRSSFF